MELYVEMMGRAPDPDAMFRREGLMPSKANDNKAAHQHKHKAPRR